MKQTSLIFIAFIFCHQLFGQAFKPSSVNGGSGLSGNSNANFSFTIGEPVNGLISNNDASFRQGFSSSFVADTTSTNTEPLTMDLIKIYPNPVKDKLTIDNLTDGQETLAIEVYNIVGKQIFSGNIEGSRIVINMSAYNAGLYLVKIKFNEERIQSYKIQKIN